MIRKNILNGLVMVAILGAVLVIFNALLRNNDNIETSASGKLSSFLRLEIAKKEVSDTSTPAVETPVTTSEPTPQAAVVTETPAPNVEAPAPTAETPAPNVEAPVTSTPAVAAGSDRVETIYTVKDGDTYGCIAEKYYGSYEHYIDIMNANPVSNYGFSEYGLFVDAQLVLPAISGANLKPASSLCQ